MDENSELNSINSNNELSAAKWKSFVVENSGDNREALRRQAVRLRQIDLAILAVFAGFTKRAAIAVVCWAESACRGQAARNIWPKGKPTGRLIRRQLQ